MKAALGRSGKAVVECLGKYWPESAEADNDAFILAFFPFMRGLYQYSNITDKQARAMEEVGLKYTFCTAPQLALAFLQRCFGLPPA